MRPSSAPRGSLLNLHYHGRQGGVARTTMHGAKHALSDLYAIDALAERLDRPREVAPGHRAHEARVHIRQKRVLPCHSIITETRHPRGEKHMAHSL